MGSDPTPDSSPQGHNGPLFTGGSAGSPLVAILCAIGLVVACPILFAVIGGLVAVSLGCFRQLRPRLCMRALTIIAAFGIGLAVVGTLVGYGLATFVPSYYRGVVSGGRQPNFNPVDVGIGLGCSEGLMLGAMVGTLVVIGLAWRQSPEHISSEEPRFSGVGPIVRHHSGTGRLLVAATVGVAVGTAWAVLMCAIASGRPDEAARHLICFPLGLGITAIVVFYLRHFPELVGLASGFLTMFAAALIVGPHDWWMGLWIMLYSVSGIICGPIVGCLLRWIPGREPGEATNGILCQGTTTRLGSRLRAVLLVALLAVFLVQGSSLCWNMWASRRRGEELRAEIGRASQAASRMGGAGAAYVTASSPEGTINRIEFNFRGRKLDDEKLKSLDGVTAIVGLDLSETQITDAGLACLKGLTTLEYLQLARTNVGDKGMEQLADLVNLELLDLTGTRVTQNCAGHLEHLPKLRKVYALGTRLSRIQGIDVDHARYSEPWIRKRPE